MQDKTRLKTLAEKAIKKFGRENQLKVVIEELAELIMTINHVERRKKDWIDLAKEIADVEIMITQLKLMTLTSEQYGKILNEKLDKLESYL